jgi:hypothetical protein
MLRNRVGRVCATLLLLWFAVTSGAPSLLHTCPVHDTVATAIDDHGEHAHQAPDGADHATCTCFGDCATSGVAPGLPAARATIALGTTSEIPEPSHGHLSPAATRPALVLPYANGPPGSVRVA